MRLEKIIKFSLVSVFCLLVAISPVLGNQMAIPKEFPVCPLTHITDALLASDGSIWVVGEGGIYKLEQKIAYLCSLPVQARTRVSQFAGSGVYKNFILQKAGTYWVRVCRNNSFNTILNGVFISKIFLPGEITSQSLKDGLSSDFCKICPLPPDLNKKSLNKQEMEFFKVWESSLAGGISSPAVLALQRNALLYQYRHLTSQQPSSTLAPLLKWNLHLWSHEDHRQFDELMTASWNRKQETMPDFRSREFMPHGPGTIPFSIREVRQMEDLGIDWKQYRDSSGSHPQLSVKEMKKMGPTYLTR